MAELSLSLDANRFLELLSKDENSIMGSLGSRGQDLLRGVKATISKLAPQLIDAEMKSFHDEGVKDWLRRLGEALYDAHNLLDDFSALPPTWMRRRQKVAKVTKQELKKIKGKLDKIESDLNERSSEVYGRDGDREEIVRHLLTPSRVLNQQEDDDVVRVLPIVGIRGVGKTTLAEYVFNDKRVVEYFGKRIFIRVSIDLSIRKMVEENTSDASAAPARSTDRKPHLIVLDGMWNGNPDVWVHQLKRVFEEVGGRQGSAMILTSRSLEVAADFAFAGTTVETEYVLGPLSKEHSWTLFQRVAFGGQLGSQDQSKISIGRQIARQCKGHPLLIRVTGTYLCRKEKPVAEWWSFYEKDFPRIKQLFMKDYDHLPSPLLIRETGSNDNLWPPLIHCIAYCSLLPKDDEIDMHTLIQLWMALGLIHPPTSTDQSLEDVGHGYFKILADTGFFHQDTRHVSEGVKKYKMHESMHHLATSAAGEHCLTLNSASDSPDTLKNASHVAFAFTPSSTRDVTDLLRGAKKLRSILFQSSSSRKDTGRVADKILDSIISACGFLRVLDMHALGITHVPSSIGNLKHLRYLDLSENEHITQLPDSINELHNLQTLKLSSCFELKKLPRDIGDLINLRHLELDGCYNLVTLPRGITQLTNLQALSQVILSEEDSMRRHQLEQLRKLKSLRGELVIKFLKHGKDEIAECLNEKLGVRSLSL